MPGRLRCYHAALRLDFGRLIKAYEMGRLAAVMVIAPWGRDQHPRIKNDPFGRRGPGVVTGGRGGGRVAVGAGRRWSSLRLQAGWARGSLLAGFDIDESQQGDCLSAS